MTPIESMFEIKTTVLGLEKYLLAKDAVVFKKTHGKYVRLIDRFFKENESILPPAILTFRGTLCLSLCR